MIDPQTYTPSIRWRLIRLGVPVVLFLLAITAYVLLNAETFERNADPDSISIPAFLVLLWVSVSGLAFVPLFLIGGTRLVISPEGFAFGGNIRGAYLNAGGSWNDVIAAEYTEAAIRIGGIFMHQRIFGLRVQQGVAEQFISLQHFRDQLRQGSLAAQLKEVAPEVLASIHRALETGQTVPVERKTASSSPTAQVRNLTQAAAQAQHIGDYDAAIQAYDKALELMPDYYELYFHLAQCQIKAGAQQEALDTLKRGFSLNPQRSTLAYNVGLTARTLGQEAEARKYLQKALTLIPADAALADKQDFARLVRDALNALPADQS